MKNLKDACHRAHLQFEEKLIDGKNSDAIIEHAASHDLVVMGALGIGAIPGGVKLGSNTRRVLQAVQNDVLIVKKNCALKTIVVGIDGSDYSLQATKRAAQIAKAVGARLHILSCYDPDLHRVVFKSLADVLSEEAGKVFKFKDQEHLHNEVIDKSLENLYRRQLTLASQFAEQYHVSDRIELLKGKPYCALWKRAEALHADLIIVGRHGMHRGRQESIGSNTERLTELSTTNVLITSAIDGNHRPTTPAKPRSGNTPQERLKWTKAAKKHLERIPGFARPMAVLAVERYAREQGICTITPDVMRNARSHYE
jgi:nucleotide-binding universal stress UspA family protein